MKKRSAAEYEESVSRVMAWGSLLLYLSGQLGACGIPDSQDTNVFFLVFMFMNVLWTIYFRLVRIHNHLTKTPPGPGDSH